MAEAATTPSYVGRFWAKSEPRHGYPKRIHLLEHHLADVGACFEALLGVATIRHRLARSAGLDDLDSATVQRLALLAALHDIGKVNIGFQTRIWQERDLPAGRRWPGRAGHVRDLTPVLRDADTDTAQWFFDALGWWWDAVESWDDKNGDTVCALFVAALSHHGSPLQLDGGLQANPGIWRSFGGLRPEEMVRRIGVLARQWFPAAWAIGAPPLPSAPDFQHMFLGLCTLADWIGSNETWFEYSDQPADDYMERARNRARQVVAEIGLDLTGQRDSLPGDLPSFQHLFGFEANAIQQAAENTSPGNCSELMRWSG